MPTLRILALSASLLMNACAPQVTYWSEAQSPKQNKVEAVRLTYDMRLPSAGTLAPAEAAGLDAFLARHEIGFGDEVSLVAPAGRNLSPVSAHLRRQGIVAAVVTDAGALPSGAVRLQVERFVVVPPNCPDWRKSATEDYGNTSLATLGCANAANLGMMLANPRDLIQGRMAGDVDGTASASATQRYRSDKLKPLPKGSTTE